MTRSVPTSNKVSFSRPITYIAFECHFGPPWIQWDTYTRLEINVLIHYSGERSNCVVRHDSYWRKLHQKEELDGFLSCHTGTIEQFTDLERKIKLVSGRSQAPLPFLLWTDEKLGLY